MGWFAWQSTQDGMPLKVEFSFLTGGPGELRPKGEFTRTKTLHASGSLLS